MTVSLALTLIGIAALDSLNPSLFFAQFYLLTTPRPVGRILAYIAGVMTVNVIGGWLLLNNARTIFTSLLASIHPTALMIGQLLIGMAILIFGLRYQAAPATDVEKKPRSLHPVYSYGFGMVVMLNELTTALPYFVAIDRIAQSQLSLSSNLMALALYNTIFALPLLSFLGAFLLFRRHFEMVIERIRRWSEVWIPRILKWAAIGFGAFLMFDVIVKVL